MTPLEYAQKRFLKSVEMLKERPDDIGMKKAHAQMGLELFEEKVLPAATEGDRESIELVLYVLGDALLYSVEIPSIYKAFLFMAFNRIHYGDSPNEAFNYKRQKGEKNNRLKNDKALQIAMYVNLLVEETDNTVTEAMHRAAEKYYVSFDTVKKYRSETAERIRLHQEVDKLIDWDKFEKGN